MMSKKELSEELDFALLRIRIARHTDGPLATAAASAAISFGTLASRRETLSVTDAPVAVDLLEALEISLKHPAKITFDHNAFGTDDVSQFCQLLIRKLTGPGIWIDPCTLQNSTTRHWANAINIGKRRFNTLLIWDVDAK